MTPGRRLAAALACVALAGCAVEARTGPSAEPTGRGVEWTRLSQPERADDYYGSATLYADVEVPDGRKVPCILFRESTNDSAGAGLSCDWDRPTREPQ